MIVVGIPTCIISLEFVLNFKLCQHYDEDLDMTVGGMTVCEAITYVFTCGDSYTDHNNFTIDNYVFKEIVIEEDPAMDEIVQ